MPPSNPGSLSEQQVIDLVAQILKANGFPPGAKPLSQPNELNTVGFPPKETPRISRLLPGGPPGAAWDARGNDRTYYYYRSAQNKNTAAGIWTSPDYSGQMHTATSTEFIYLLEGAITLLHKSGVEEVFKAGDALVIPRGTEFQWKQSDNVRGVLGHLRARRWSGDAAALERHPGVLQVEPRRPARCRLEGFRAHQASTSILGARTGRRSASGRPRPYTSAGFHKTTYAELMVFLCWPDDADDAGWPGRAFQRGRGGAGP